MKVWLGVLLGAAALALSGGAVGGGVAAPAGLHAFLLTPAEAPLQYYPRTPSFSWNPVGTRGGSYEFQLATSRNFADSNVLFDYAGLKIPAVSVNHQLPWMTGDPYALWARVRWESAGGKIVTPWSKPFGFNMRWLDNDVPRQLPAPVGLVRWAPIEGATRYEVLYTDLHPTTAFLTTTNVADEREFFTFHDQFGWGATIHWRVRAIRYIDDKDVLKNGLPRASYGPWSPTFATVNPAKSTGALAPMGTVSDQWEVAGKQAAPHELMPGFSWTPSSPATTTVSNFGSSLYRVYIFTDKYCVNQVFAGSIVGSPAFAPRVTGGPFDLPQDTKTLGEWDGAPYMETEGGSEGNALDATGVKVTSNEVAGKSLGETGATSSSSSASSSSSNGANVDLWDSGWPSGRFYWTVVPVTVEQVGVPDPTKPNSAQPIEYQDTAVAQDACESGDVMSFGKVSAPVVTSSSTPFVSGLSPNGRMVASASKVPTLHDSPLVAWEPATGAVTYEVQMSRTKYPWRAKWDKQTDATSIVLPLGPKNVGTWWYRVRGINPALPPGAQAMTWSAPVRIKISGDRFVVK
ncbi:MAG TPA: hypothetical protein VFW85_09930 [Gaiellaceae bacterium]|nr:hypothetical protein [Gaiellaceae bacterium]